jgi:hypothetical protein
MIDQARSESERASASQALEQVGVSALPMVVNKLHGGKIRPETRRSLQLVASHLGCLVSQVTVQGNTEGIEDWLSKANDFEQAPLISHNVVRFVEELIQRPPSTDQEISIQGTRKAGGYGICLEFTFSQQPTHNGEFTLNSGFSSDGKELGGESRSAGFPDDRDRGEILAMIGKLIKDTLAAPPDTYFHFSIAIGMAAK